jgi:hypothetical protein
MSDGLGALVIMGAGIGGYAIYRHWKRNKDREERYRDRVGAPECGPMQYWDAVSQACTQEALGCIQGQFYDYPRGRCVPLGCPQGQFYDYPRGRCVPQARTGYFEYPGEDVTGFYSWSRGYR